MDLQAPKSPSKMEGHHPSLSHCDVIIPSTWERRRHYPRQHLAPDDHRLPFESCRQSLR
ncbi:hypothetical protein AERO9A_140182 [Aeromonas salmonicida]|nr:hypothetical protein AERO9A_140182 [Aeromonas salmonicida]